MNRLIALAIGFFLLTGCSKERPPIPTEDPTVEVPYSYGGTYEGLFRLKEHGVDENGIFKHDTSYAYSVTVSVKNEKFITIEKGPFSLDSIVVDSAGTFMGTMGSINIEGYFIRDSLYIYHKSLSGSHAPPQWFVIREMSFRGRKIF